MPVKRRVSKIKAGRITPEAVAAYKAGDCMGLHRALGLRPWNLSPLPASISPLGVDQGAPPEWMTDEGQRADWREAQELQRALEDAVQAGDGSD